MANLTTDQLQNSKLNGVSSGPHTFTTEGEKAGSAENVHSEAKFSVTDEKSNNLITKGIVSGKYNVYPKNLLNRIVWSWQPNHNTPGYVTGSLKCELDGAGTEDNMISMEGGSAYLNFQGLEYTPPTNEKSERYTKETITLEYPANSTYGEDGATITLENLHDLGQIAYNTPAPIIYYNVENDPDENMYLVNSDGNMTSSFKFDSGKYDDVFVRVLPNVPKDATLGTVSGTPMISKYNNRIHGGDSDEYTVSYTANTIGLIADNAGQSFNITEPDNTGAKTTDREVTLNFSFNKETNNVRPDASVSSGLIGDETSVTIYQSGGDSTLPSPNITYRWVYYEEYSSLLGGDPVLSYFSSVAIRNRLAIFNWKENPNSKGYSKGTISWKTAPTNPSTNEGDEQYLTLQGLTMVEPTNAKQRYCEPICVVRVENAQNAPIGNLEGNCGYALIGSQMTPYYGVIAKSIISQEGTSWESPDLYLNLKVTPASTNPSNVTNDSSRIPSCTINGSTTASVRVYTDGKGNMLHDEIKLVLSNNMPSTTTGKNSGTIPITGGANNPNPATFGPFTKIYVYYYDGKNEVNWALNSIPAMSECKYSISAEISKYGSTTKNANDSTLVTNGIKTIEITDGGNEQQNETYKSEIVRVSNSNPNYFYVTPSYVTIDPIKAQMITSGYLSMFTVATSASNAASLTSVKGSNIVEDGDYIRCDLSAIGTNTTDQETTIKLSTGTDVKLSIDTFNYLLKGQNYSGTIAFTFTPVRTVIGGTGSITPETNVSITETNPIIGTITSRNRGTYANNYKINTDSDGYVNVGNSAGSKTVSLVNSISIGTVIQGNTLPQSVKYNVKGVLNDDVVGNDSLKGTTVVEGTVTISAGVPYTPRYEWIFTPADGVTGVTLSNADTTTVTINYPANTNPSNTSTPATWTWKVSEGDTFPDTVEPGTPVFTCSNGITGGQDERTLGTLFCGMYIDDLGIGIDIGSVTVKQAGIAAGTTTAGATINASSLTNAICTLRKSTAASGSGSTSVTISGGETVVIDSILPISTTSNRTFLGIDSNCSLNVNANSIVVNPLENTTKTASLRISSVDNNGTDLGSSIKCYYSCNSMVKLSFEVKTVNGERQFLINNSTTSRTLKYTGYDESHKGLYKFTDTTTITPRWSSGNTTYWDPISTAFSSEYTPDKTKPQSFSVTLSALIEDTICATGTASVKVYDVTYKYKIADHRLTVPSLSYTAFETTPGDTWGVPVTQSVVVQRCGSGDGGQTWETTYNTTTTGFVAYYGYGVPTSSTYPVYTMAYYPNTTSTYYQQMTQGANGSDGNTKQIHFWSVVCTHDGQTNMVADTSVWNWYGISFYNN